ncbi:hypothetical protein KI387_043710, partial [Taxus chinensis]
LMRCGKSCRLRWMNHLRPNVKRGHISSDEEDLIIRLHNLLGNRWSLIAGRVPGRTDNEVKNYWNTHLSKKLRRESLARCKTMTQIVQGQVLYSADHQNTKAKGAIKPFDDDTLNSRSKNQSTVKAVFPNNFRFASSPVFANASKQGYSRGLPDSQLRDLPLKCIVDGEKSGTTMIEDEYNACGAENEVHSSTENMEEDMADFVAIPGFEESMNTKELWANSCNSSWTWFDSLFCEDDMD